MSFWKDNLGWVLGFGLLLSSSIFSAEISSSRKIELRIAAAADLKFTLDEMIQAFQKKQGLIFSSRVSYGSSGSLAVQLNENAPFDLFFSANTELVDLLIKKGVADSVSKITYARGTLVLWIPNTLELNPADFSMKTLLSPKIKKIAMANPVHAPYGRAAEAAMTSAKIYSELKNKLVYGENIAQATQFVQSGAAQVGLIALSLAKAPLMRQGKYWVIPQDLYPPIDQVAVRIKASKNSKLSSLFLDFVKSSEGKAILFNSGFFSVER